MSRSLKVVQQPHSLYKQIGGARVVRATVDLFYEKGVKPILS